MCGSPGVCIAFDVGSKVMNTLYVQYVTVGSCMLSGGAPTPLAHRCSKFHIKFEVKT